MTCGELLGRHISWMLKCENRMVQAILLVIYSTLAREPFWLNLFFTCYAL
jgi:hypothetical protein